MYDVVTSKEQSVCEIASEMNESVDVGRLCSAGISNDVCIVSGATACGVDVGSNL